VQAGTLAGRTFALERSEGLVPKWYSLSDNFLDDTVQFLVFLRVEVVDVACDPIRE